MKKLLLIAFLFCGGSGLQAQFLVSGYGSAGYNAPGFFKDFRNYYNEVNAADLSKNMSLPVFSKGYSYALGYRVLHLSATVGRTQLGAKANAELQNGSKREIKFEYTFTTVTAGYFHASEKSEFSIEAGMLHSYNHMYVYTVFPNKEKDFFRGISQQLNWANLGGAVKFNYLRRLNDKLFFDVMLQGLYLNNKRDVAPKLTVDGHSATLNYIGLSFSACLTLKLGKYHE